MSASQKPLPVGAAMRALIRCVGATAALLIRCRVHLAAGHLGLHLRFADGTTSWVYRETVVDRAAPVEPCVLVVGFRLRGVRGRGHVLFRWESLLHTPLFVGFPGYVSKLWLAHDDHDVYRGLYEWDGPDRAEAYARALWRVLTLVCARGSIRYRVLPGVRRDDVLDQPQATAGPLPIETSAWYRPVEVLPVCGPRAGVTARGD